MTTAPAFLGTLGARGAHALARLKPDERSLLAMRYVAGLDSTDIAAQLGLTSSGVRSRLARLVERQGPALCRAHSGSAAG